MEMRGEVKGLESIDTGHGYMRVVPAIVAAIVLGLAVLAATVIMFLQRIPRLLRPEIPVAAPALPSFGGELGLPPLLPGAILLVLVGIFVLLLVLVMCSCCCKGGGGSGLPLPGLPDLSKIAPILRNIARALRAAATQINTANRIVNDVRQKLSTVTSFKVTVPKFSNSGINVDFPGVYQGPLMVPDGTEERSPFDATTEQKLTTFVNDVTGKSALDGASTMLTEKADLLDQQAHALDGQ